MKNQLLLITFLCCSMLMNGQILPSPMTVNVSNGSFTLKNNCVISYKTTGAKTANYLISQLKKSTGFDFKTQTKSNKRGILFKTASAALKLGEEGYLLEVTPRLITICASSEVGMFYGVQSLLQLFPVEVFSSTKQAIKKWDVTCQKIIDQPKYGFRSFMLDSGRQFQSVAFIKRYLDFMALLKMNVFHWHLTEGQGWRIEIKKYPLLASVGSKVAKGKEQNGFYTQEDIRTIVAYAKSKHITVIPEIDVPGHSEAALTAYPAYTCFNKVPESVMAFSSHLFCAGNEKTYVFLENILDEICELFPSQYIHLGGDEAPKNDWNRCEKCQHKIVVEGLHNSHDLQLYFSKRLANYLKKKNKKVIFWGDVVYQEGTKLPDNVVVEWWNWRSHKDTALKKAIERGHQVIAGSNYYSYLNFPVTPWSRYKENRTFDLKTIYEQNPSDLEKPNALVLGMSASLWTDWHVQEHMIDRRVFPRIYALTEQMWHVGKRLTFDDFYTQVKLKYKMLKILGIDYGPAMETEIGASFKWD